MLAKIREARENDEGFTLIELLVVVIIIGILAAIAIPSFLNQRERAWQAELTSGVRNFALEIEAEATKNGGTYPDATAATPAQPAGVTDPGSNDVVYKYVPVGTAGAHTGFALCGTHAKITDTHSVSYNTAATPSGIQPFSDTAC